MQFPFQGSAAYGERKQCLAKECVGSNRIRKKRSQLLKDIKRYAIGITDGIRQATAAIVDEAACRKVYLYSSVTRKEERAREIVQEDGVTSGLICVLDCVEPCWSYHIDKTAEKKRLELRLEYSKCLHHYFCFLDPASSPSAATIPEPGTDILLTTLLLFAASHWRQTR